MKRLMLKQLILGACVMAGTVWADTIVGKTNESIWAYIPPKWKAEDEKRFSGTLELGVKQQNGTKSFQEISGAFGLKYDAGIYEAIQTVNFDYLESEDVVSKNKLKSYTGFDYFIGHRIWVFILNDYEYNPPQSIQLKLRTGPGLKYDILRNPFWKFNVGVAPLNRLQISTDDTQENDQIMSFRLLFKMKTDSITYNMVGFYMPSLCNSSYEWSTDTSLVFDLTTYIALKIGWLFTYDSEPLAADVSKWESEYYTRVQLKF